ncbi:Hypothetical predicted protein [Paramuricea clavata]|uniref:Reverse transcriptase domain-containing protein n=1 Tax=Paramuricea clavata TaxID=317549 RepID=A0A6S7JIA6_PARCT|nr:Hypothetical predicted protein [Paramuricea clavata]
MRNTRKKLATIDGSQPLLQPEVDTPQEMLQCCHIRVAESHDIKPFEEIFIWGKLEDKNEKFTRDSYIEERNIFSRELGFLQPPIKISAEMMDDENKISICILNTTDKSIRVYREQTAATIQELPSTHNIVHISESNMEIIHHHNMTQSQKRHNLGLTQKINEAVGNHVKSGHLTPSKSTPWAFPIVPVLKPDKTVRLCVDYRPRNKITQNDPYPTGNLQEVLDNLSDVNYMYFSVIDLAQGYFQVPLAKEDRPKTAFRSPTGFWEWTRMPYGIKRKSGNFFSVDAEGSRTHRLALCMDDICIISKTFEEHLVNLQGVFDALRQHGLRINAKKSAFAMKEEQDDASSTLRHELVKAPVLAHQVKSTSSDEDRPQTSSKDPGTERSFWTKSDIDERYSRIRTTHRDYSRPGNHMADALSRIGWNVKWEERDEDTNKVATIGALKTRLVYARIEDTVSPATVREKTERLRETVSEVFQKAQESDAKLTEKRRERYNSKTSFKSLGVGQQVWKRNLRAKTFADRWTGPYVVVKPTLETKTSYVVRRNNGTKEEIVYYNYLKPYQIQPVKKPKSRNPPEKNGVGHPALDTSEDSESDSREEEMQLERKYPETIRRPPKRYT